MNFLRNVLAVIVGLLLFSIIGFFVFIGIVGALSAETKVKVEPNSVLRLDLNRPIVEMTAEDPFAELFPNVKTPVGLLDLKRAIEYAKTDENIKGIYLDCGQIMAGYASLQEIRAELKDFKESGKFIVSYSEMYTEAGYYVASAADEVLVANESIIFEFNGMSYNAVFFKGLLDKLGIEPEVYRVGEFKAAVEPFIREDLSPENEMQISSFINSIYTNILQDVSASRNISVEDLRNISSEMLVYNGQDALKANLVDSLVYVDQVQDILKNRLGLEQDAEIEYASIENYIKASEPSTKSLNRIAVVVASGEIVDGKGDNERVGSDEFIKILQDVRKDNNIKAVVMRINSPGGSGTASDMIWREIVLTSEKKPVIASMSDLAASGGYYLAMPCDTIVANPTTITGSIGVFGLMLNLQEFLNDKLGITTDVVKTGKYSDIFNMTRPHTPEEQAMIQKMIDNFYETFVTKVAEGRGMTVEKVKEVAQGRVWTGEQAIERGLVDVLGNFEDAVELAAAEAGIDDYKLRFYPQKKTFIEQLMEGFNTKVETNLLKSQLGEDYYYLRKVQDLKNMTGVQARMPFDLIIK